MKRLLILLVSALFSSWVIPAANAHPQSITVMSRNLYLGADVGIAMNLLPDFPAATQFMWDQMRQTNFPKRSELFAKEIKAAKPDVIGLQEATNWYCQKNALGQKVIVYDFVEILLAQLKQQGLNYTIAQKDGQVAQNVGFEISPIAFLTKANDPEIFQEIFGQDYAYCGFEIADVLLIQDKLSADVVAVGTAEYEAKYTIIPTLMTVYRGYAWADIDFSGKPVRFVTTHLESLFDETNVPVAKLQADQLISDLASTKIPLVVMGDFNSDPRDPRGKSSDNPGGQPVENELCPQQKEVNDSLNGDATCNAYWTMINAGFQNTSPEPFRGENFSWGLNALVTGADPVRQQFAQKMGNDFGFTDRLDYVFSKGEINLKSTQLIGNANQTEWASDHAGVVTSFELIGEQKYEEVRLAAHSRFPVGFWDAVFMIFAAGVTYLAFLRVRLKHRLKRSFLTK